MGNPMHIYLDGEIYEKPHLVAKKLAFQFSA